MAIDFSKQYLVLGVGITGASVVRFLLSHNASVRVADSRLEHPSTEELSKQYASLDLHEGEFVESLLDGIDILVINPGLSSRLPLVVSAQARGIELLGDIELFARAVQCPVLAVTGTNGKSTVVSMLQAMAEHSDKTVLCGGNIGQPALDLLEQRSDAVILELSSYQLETTHSLAPVAASVLNVSEDHMDRYDGMAAYVAAKRNVYRQCELALWLKEDEQSAPQAGAASRVAVTAGIPGEGELGIRDRWLCAGERQLFDLRTLGAPGKHNELNACFAWGLGRSIALPDVVMAAGLRAFTGLRHRTELVAEIDGVKYFNDSKGTNVGATLVALNSMMGKVVLLAGGDGKSQDFSPLLPALLSCARAVITFGVDGDQVAQVARAAVPVSRAESLESAIALGREQAEPGDCVLLSPACASFDMFKSYQDRGDAFVACVERMRA